MKNLITCLVVCVLSGTTFATTWTVDDDGKADFDNIQAAIDASSNGDEIIVMPGTYTSTANEVVDMLGKEIWLHSSKGAQVTIIDGEGARRGILCNSGETTKTIIEGITITNCYASYGGGMFNSYSSPTLTDCTFTGNNSGGMYNGDNSSPTLNGCTFINNTAIAGGGMYNGAISSPTLTNCSFTGNTANDGGGMYNQNSSSPTLTGCTFENNIANGGGGMFNSGSSPTLENCIFTSNTAPYGGGMFNSGSSPTLENCTFENNTADTYGGGMYNSVGSPTLTNCTFTGNTADTYGGGIYNSSGNPTLTDTTVCGNTPDQIYGSYIDGGGNTVTNDCPNSGACCTNNTCVISEQSDCQFFAGEWMGANTDCIDACQSTCMGDINGDGTVNVNDLLILIAVWGSCP